MASKRLISNLISCSRSNVHSLQLKSRFDKDFARHVRLLDSTFRHCYSTESTYKATRGPYSEIQASDIETFRNILETSRVLVAPEDDVEGYNVDYIRSVKGNGKVVLKPKTTEELSKIMKHCSARQIAVVPQGGNTGLNAGSNPVFDEVIISTSLMNEILGFDELQGVLTCQSGCVLHTLEEYLKDQGFIMPLDLGAKESCQIGGNLSTNAGGLRVLRYGSLHSTVLGLEAVLPDGTVLDCLSTNKKDNTGYHLKHLFIGSEGTLGILSKIAIQCPMKPSSVNLAFLGVENYSKLLQTYREAKKDLVEILSAVEYIDIESIKAAEQNLQLRCPIDSAHPYYMMIETAGSNQTHDEEKLNSFLEKVISQKLVIDGTVASEPSHMSTMWNVRERLADALLADGSYVMYDISVPIDSFEQFVEDTKSFLADKGHENSVKRVAGFGHLGDGNIHLTVTQEKFDHEVQDGVEAFVYQKVADLRGSISSEHGLGYKKRHLIHHSKSKEAVNMMREIKKALDPTNILNPYKVLPDQDSDERK